MSIFSKPSPELFGNTFESVDDALSGLENEVESLAGDAPSSFGMDEDYGSDGLFSQYGQDNTALVTDRGEDASARIVVSAGLEAAIGQAFNPSLLQTMPKFVEWVNSVFPDFVLDQSFISKKGTTEARDIARQFTTQVFVVGGDRLSAADWGQMTQDEKIDFVNQAVGSSVFLNHADSIDQLSAAWDRVSAANGWVEKAKAAGSGWWAAAKAFWGQDVWPAVKGLLPWTDEQDLNMTAMIYFAGHKVWGAANWVSSGAGSALSAMDPYPKIVKQIDDAYASVGGFTATESAPQVRASAPVLDVPAPPAGGYAEESIPAGNSGMLPRPETILAFGYVVAAAPTLLKALF